ncbi:hypothetical protein QR721_10360 [Aciduricibacillus chroicocephali]|uniref:Uncharacterized protein n=1 Tax=Aciduricibacillus chroicocephali TaxID=3054939 RepID=A0ABY9KU28_9BACI|nr:hypothetical protein QR721_10360 [Bacillaceae bacterium 44XB]
MCKNEHEFHEGGSHKDNINELKRTKNELSRLGKNDEKEITERPSLSGKFMDDDKKRKEKSYKKTTVAEESGKKVQGDKPEKEERKQDTDVSKPPTYVPPCPSWQNGAKGIANCKYCYTYIWQFNGMNYWFYPFEIFSRTVTGLIWARQRWSYHTIPHNAIRAHYRHR